jgi:deoxyribodipyrimidine photo-lyase
MNEIKSYIWIRSDFRLTDNPALYYGVQNSINDGGSVPIFILDPYFFNNPTYARRVRYLLKLIIEFRKSIPNLQIIFDNPIGFFKAKSEEFEGELKVYANADYDPFSRQRDLEVSKIKGIKLLLFEDKITVDKKVVTKTTSNIYSIFTPFKKAVMEEFLNSKSLPIPESFENWLAQNKIEIQNNLTNKQVIDLNSKIPKLAITVSQGEYKKVYDLENQNLNLDFKNIGYISEKEAILDFALFLKNSYEDYSTSRDDLYNINGTSHMSIALKWGLVTSRTLKDLVTKVDKNPEISTFISELIWREFYKYLLYHYPKLLEIEFLTKYREKDSTLWFDTNTQEKYFTAWIEGVTGYDIVDASIMQIQKEGWMHNRARMVVASILTKNLGVNWRWGQEYFRAMLLDLDESANSGGWQWGASVGADPKPIRIFNPYLQEDRFDPKFEFREKYLHGMLRNEAIIDHSYARNLAIQRYKDTTKGL